MSWVSLLIIAYFLISLTALADKFLLNNVLPHPVVYAFIVSVLGLVSLLFIPFGFFVPTFWQLFISLIAGFSFTFSLLFLYSALKHGEASRVFTSVGSLTAVFTFLFSYLFLQAQLNRGEIFSFILLIIGGIFISLNFKTKKISGKHSLVFSIIAAILLSISYTGSKYVYTGQGFISGFVWIRIFAFVAGLCFLIIARNRKAIKSVLDKKSAAGRRSNQLILLGGQTSSALGFFILNYAISLKNPAIVLAAQGLQYAFLFIMTLSISFWLPKILKEEVTAKIILQKSLAIILIAVGLGVLALS